MGVGGLVCAGPRNAAVGCSVCSAQCTVIRTQPALLTPPGQLPHGAASTCLNPAPTLPGWRQRPLVGAGLGRGGWSLQAGPGCPLCGAGVSYGPVQGTRRRPAPITSVNQQTRGSSLVGTFFWNPCATLVEPSPSDQFLDAQTSL